jgi:chromosome segregation ATPase
MLPILTLSQPTDTQIRNLQPEIRLPSITSRWKRPEDKDGAEITIEDLERCTGEDLGLRRELSEVKQQQLSLERERLEIENRNNELKQSVVAIEKNRAIIQEQNDRMKSESETLAIQARAIEKTRQSSRGIQVDIRAINSLIATYNADVARHNKRRATLIIDNGTFNKSVELYNVKSTDLSQQVLVFNKHNDAFQDVAAKITRKSDQYTANCAGKRILKK